MATRLSVNRTKTMAPSIGHATAKGIQFCRAWYAAVRSALVRAGTGRTQGGGEASRQNESTAFPRARPSNNLA